MLLVVFFYSVMTGCCEYFSYGITTLDRNSKNVRINFKESSVTEDG